MWILLALSGGGRAYGVPGCVRTDVRGHERVSFDRHQVDPAVDIRKLPPGQSEGPCVIEEPGDCPLLCTQSGWEQTTGVWF